MPDQNTVETAAKGVVETAKHVVGTDRDALMILGSIFIVGSLGGLSALLRSNKPVTTRQLISACLNSGLISLIIALVWWASYKDTNVYFLVGVSLLAGLGGATTLDFSFQFAKKYLSGKGFSIHIESAAEETDNEVIKKH